MGTVRIECVSLVTTDSKETNLKNYVKYIEDAAAIIATSEQETCTWTETKDGVNVKAGDGELIFIATDGDLAMKVLNARIIFEKQ